MVKQRNTRGSSFEKDLYWLIKQGFYWICNQSEWTPFVLQLKKRLTSLSCVVGSIPFKATLSNPHHPKNTHTQCHWFKPFLRPSAFKSNSLGGSGEINGCLGRISVMQQVSSAVLRAHMHALWTTDRNRTSTFCRPQPPTSFNLRDVIWKMAKGNHDYELMADKVHISHATWCSQRRRLASCKGFSPLGMALSVWRSM